MNRLRIIAGCILGLVCAPFIALAPLHLLLALAFAGASCAVGVIQYPTAGAIYYTQFAPSSVQSICDSVKNALVTCGWTPTTISSSLTATFNGLPSNDQNATIAGTVYTFVTSLTSTPNQIKIGATAAACANNLYEAINAGPNSGTDYSSTTVANATVSAALTGASGVIVSSRSNFNFTVSNSWSNVTWSGTTSRGYGYNMLMPLTPQGLSARFLVDDSGNAGYARFRVATADMTVVSGTDGYQNWANGVGQCNVVAGRSLEFCGCAHQLFIFLLGAPNSGDFMMGVPYIRAAHTPSLISAISNTSPAVVTTSAAHGVIAGQDIYIADAGPMAGFYTVSAVTATTLTLAATAGNGGWTSGGVVAGPGQISRAIWMCAAIGATLRNDAAFGAGTGGASEWLCLNQYYYAVGNGASLAFTMPRPIALNFGGIPDLAEPRIGWGVQVNGAPYQVVGQLWASFLVMEPNVIDRAQFGFDGHDWIQIINNDTTNKVSFWLAKR